VSVSPYATTTWLVPENWILRRLYYPHWGGTFKACAPSRTVPWAEENL
jgi:hypothetical protein